MGRPAPSPVTTCNCLYHITDTTFTIQPSMFQFLKSLPKRKPKISRAFCVVSRGRILACHRIFAGKACLGAFICAWPSRKLRKFRERFVLFHPDVSWLVTSIFAGKACLGAFLCAWPRPMISMFPGVRGVGETKLHPASDKLST